MNYIFISPNYPDFYYRFCQALQKQNVNVFGIGDSGFIKDELRSSLVEYHVLQDMTNFSKLQDTVANIISRYGEVEGIDSINEYWLESESKLRDIFKIPGTPLNLMEDYKYKSKMKSRFKLAHVPVAPFKKSDSRDEILAFAYEYGFPLFSKPDNGVGAEGTLKINDMTQLNNFLFNNPFHQYIFEVYVEGEIYSFDGLTDKNGEIVFKVAHHFYNPIEELKLTGAECIYETLVSIPQELEKLGIATVKAFELKQSFFHIEFFKLTKDLPTVATTNQFLGLEANMRIAGGYTGEMIYHATGIDIYKAWAATVTGVPLNIEDYRYTKKTTTVINIARKIGRHYKHSFDDIKSAFKDELILGAETSKEENPFGNFEIIAGFEDKTKINEFIEYVTLKTNI